MKEMGSTTIYALHGAVGHHSDWKILDDLPVTVEALDLWRTDMLGGQLAWAQKWVGDVARSGNDADQRILLGYSMGGRLALHALVAGRTLWDRVIIVSAHYGLNNDEQAEARRVDDALWSEAARELPWDDFLQKWNGQAVLGEPLWDRQNLEEDRWPISQSFLDWSLGNQMNLLPVLKPLRIPTLWLVGEKDEKFRRIAEVADQSWPELTVEVVPECGHRVPWEKTEAFLTSVRRFLDI